ncbi:hypothetical protein DFJ74DRAFT_657901 [Hyaloraphidium curvatum]|nr:hypothetical protein DFJ74DRAFT_657901 [Hyaloraphidium curvatum]
MAAVQTSLFTPNPVALSDPVLLDLRKRMRGRIVTPQDTDFDFLISDGVFNKLQTNRPRALLQPVGTADVSAILKYLTSKKIEFTVSGGRHTMRCFKTNVVTIDLRLMRGVIVDRERKVAHVQGGAKLADFDGECHAQGLCTVTGSDPRTGVGGYLLGGGWGWLSRKWGMACDNILEVECVLADGSVVIASEKEHPDLFWALRGAGASFAVCTRFTLKLYDLPKTTIAGFQLYPEGQGKECLRAVRDHIKTAPREVATMWELNWGPPNPQTGVRRPFAQILPIYLGDSEQEGWKLLKPVMERVPNPFVKNVGVIKYSTLQSMLVTHIHPSFRTETALFVPEIPDELVDILFEQFEKSPLPGTFLACFAIGGAIGDKEPGETAFPWRLKSGHWITCLASATNEKDHKTMEGWVAETAGKIMKFSTGQFANRIGNASTADSGYDAAMDFFGKNTERLRALKAKYDPGNAFHNSDSGALVVAEEKASL